MLRIDNQYARRAGRWRVLAYILEMHEAGKAFRRAQEDGHVPWDEPFIHNSILDMHDPSRPQFTGLDQAALVALRAHLSARRVMRYAQWGRHTGGHAEARGLAWLPNGQFLTSRCAIRDFAIQGIAAAFVAEELATAELGWVMKRYQAEEAVALSNAQGATLLAEFGSDAFGAPGGWMLRYSAGVAAS